MLRHSTVDRDLRFVDCAPFAIENSDADGLRGAQVLRRLVRRDLVAEADARGPNRNSLGAGRFAPVPWIIIIAWLQAVRLIATATVASVRMVRRIFEVSRCWKSLVVVSECQRGGDRRGVIRRVASAPVPQIERSGHSS
jgi:hypothetical protein